MGRTGQSTPRRHPPDQGGLRDRARQAPAAWKCSAPTIRHPDGTCVRDYIHVTDLARAHSDALSYLGTGGASDVFNCGYGRGFSVLEVIDAVKRVSGARFPRCALAPRRAGDPAAIVAGADKIRETLGWQPRFADLDGIVQQALDWEGRLLVAMREAS